MSTSILKKEIHEAIERINDPETLKAFHALVTEKNRHGTTGNGNSNYELTPDEIKELDKRHEDFLSGRVKYKTLDDLIKSFNAIRKKHRQKNSLRTAGRKRIQRVV